MINNYVDYQYQACHLIHPFDQDKLHSLYLGDVSSAMDLEFIRSSNIKTVVTAAASLDQVQFQPDDNIKHIVYSVLDHKSENLFKYFDDFYELVQREIQRGSILVHCAAGISRSSTLVISYFMKKKKWTFKQAIKYVRNSRPSVLPNLGFERQLKEYEKIIFQQENRRLKSKTSESSKHTLIKNQILPQIGILRGSSTKNRVMEVFRANKKEEYQQKGIRLNFMFNSQLNKNELKFNAVKYQHFQKFKPISRQLAGQTKSVSLQIGIDSRNFRNREEGPEITSYMQIKTDQSEVASCRKYLPSRNGLFDSAIIPIKYSTVNRQQEKLEISKIKFNQLNPNNIAINKINLVKPKNPKKNPTLSLVKVGMEEMFEGCIKNEFQTNGMDMKTKINFPIKRNKAKESISELNGPMISKKQIGILRKQILPFRKQNQRQDFSQKDDASYHKRTNIKNLLLSQKN